MIHKPENIFIFEHAIVDGYIGGNGNGFYVPALQSKKRYYAPLENHYGSRDSSMFVVEVPLGYKEYHLSVNDIDFTGHHRYLAQRGGDITAISRAPPHYPTNFRVVNFWNISMRVGTKPKKRGLMEVNTWCAQELVYARANKQRMVKVRQSHTHWGDKGTYDGCAGYRNGQQSSPAGTVIGPFA